MPFIWRTCKKQLCIFPPLYQHLLASVICRVDSPRIRGKTVIMHIVHLSKCSPRMQKAKKPKCSTPGCPYAKCRSGTSRHQELTAVNGAANTRSGSFRDTRELSAMLPTTDYRTFTRLPGLLALHALISFGREIRQ